MFDFAPDKQVLVRLYDLQQKKISFPFPSAPLRNYNVFGCGFDETTQDWPACYQWPGVPLNSWDEDKFQMVRIQLKKFAEDKQHPVWCPSVEVICKVLDHLEALGLTS